MGGISKPLYPLNGKPCIAYSLAAFGACQEIGEIVLVVRPEDEDGIREAADQVKINKPLKIVHGGKTRQESVQNGFLAIDPKADLVAIHDGARPLITPEAISLVLRDAIRHGAATFAARVTDTVKRAGDGLFIAETLDRDELFLVKTPQIFLTDLYRVSLALAQKNGLSVTDDNALAENAGFKVKLTLVDEDNDKLTVPSDAARLERILKERG
ncbi:MAG: 2-C-methyl-D-erythritol 4-phosphate cytidylyltransferase, partial [Clostridia bacterium]|nr:2-C-methyl-D-erythritol 4-phosphate cytidylyltransferase [Clostridia bacterium]